MIERTTIAVCADPPHEVTLQERADGLADALGVTKTRLGEPGCALLLAMTEARLELRVLGGEQDLIGGKPVYADPLSIDTTSPAGRSLNSPLLRAVGIKKGQPRRPSVVDCTAGLGEDAWLLASHGCVVTAVERQPVIAALLADALERAAAVRPETAGRLTLNHGDAAAYLRDAIAAPPPDAIVLDPMFPTGRRARERKPMRVLRLLAGDDDDASALLDAALATGAHRVCVKRPLQAPAIANDARGKPDVVYKGKAVRFDVYLNP